MGYLVVYPLLILYKLHKDTYYIKDITTNKIIIAKTIFFLYFLKISIKDYIVFVQGYYFTAANNNTNVLLQSSIATANIEGYQIYAYRNDATNTWFLRAFVNNSTFRSGTGFVENPIDLFLNLIIYRNGFIAKSIDNITVNMDNSETGVAPLPAGF